MVDLADYRGVANEGIADVTSAVEGNTCPHPFVTSTPIGNSDPVTSEVLGNTDPTPPSRPTSSEEAVDVGFQLMTARFELKGRFKTWVALTCPFSFMSACRYMSAAQQEIDADAKERAAEDARLIASFTPTERLAGERIGKDQLIELFDLATYGLETSRGDVDRGAALVAFALETMPNATVGDVMRAAILGRVRLLMMAKELDELERIHRDIPDDCLLSSSPMAQRALNERKDHAGTN